MMTLTIAWYCKDQYLEESSWKKNLIFSLKQQLMLHLLKYFHLVPDMSWSFIHYKILIQQIYIGFGLQTLKIPWRLRPSVVIFSWRKYLYIGKDNKMLASTLKIPNVVRLTETPKSKAIFAIMSTRKMQ